MQLNAGFTLVEVIVVLFITAGVLVVMTPIYGNLVLSSQLNENASQIIQVIRLARERSAARFYNGGYGVYLQPDWYVLYKGPSYALRDSAFDREIFLDNGFGLSWNLSGAALDEINFSKGLGLPGSTGIIVLSHEGGLRRVVINEFGLIEER